MTYDNSYNPPDWWLERLAEVMTEQGWDDSDVMLEARNIDGRERRWDSSRLSKMRSRKSKGTIQMVVAISKAARIPSPVFEAADLADAEAIDRWLSTRPAASAKPLPRRAAALQALDATVEAAKDQTRAVNSKDEGSPRDPRTRRASGRR